MIKIEVTGQSIVEVADKLLAIGSNLKGSAIIEGARAAVNAMQVLSVANGGTDATTREEAFNGDPIMPEVAEAAASNPTPQSDEPSSSPEEASSGPRETTPPASASEELNFETDVAPYVLQVVKEKGKPVAMEILSQFGVEKASLLDPAQWPELVETLKGAL